MERSSLPFPCNRGRCREAVNPAAFKDVEDVMEKTSRGKRGVLDQAENGIFLKASAFLAGAIYLFSL